MKKIKLMITSALAAVALCFGFAVTPFTTFAQETVDRVETEENIAIEEVIKEEELAENTQNEGVVEDKEITYDDILSLMGDIAEKEGFEDEWEKTLYYLETAASEKKVDAMILLSALVLAFLMIYATVKVIRYKLNTTKKDIKEISGKINGVEGTQTAQTKAINGLIDEEEKIDKDLQVNTEKEKELAMGMEKQAAALRCLIRGTKIDQNLKDEAFRALNEADEHFSAAKK